MRPVLTVALVLASATGIIVACSFPDVTFSSTEGGEGGLRNDGGRRDAVTLEATTRTGETERVDASNCKDKPTCDCDEDGYKDKNCDAGAAVDANLEEGDCDDLDPLRHPGQGPVKDVPPDGKDGDWDCDGVVTTIPNTINCTNGI